MYPEQDLAVGQQASGSSGIGGGCKQVLSNPEPSNDVGSRPSGAEWAIHVRSRSGKPKARGGVWWR